MPLTFFVEFWSRAIGGAIDQLVQGFTTAMAGPMWVSLAFWVALTGVRFANGDVEEEGKVLFRRVIGMSLVVAFATSAPLITQYVKDFYWRSLPHWFNQTMSASGIGSVEEANAAALGMTLPGNFGTDLEVVNAHAWRAISATWKTLEWYDFFGWLTLIGVVVSDLWQIAFALLAYLFADFMTGLLIGLAAPFFATALFPYTKPFFDRWLGKVISLVLVKVMVVAVATMVVQSDLVFLDMIRNRPIAPDEGELQQIRSLAGVILVFVVGAFIMLGAAIIAYHLGGSGGAPSVVPAVGIGRGGAAGGGMIRNFARNLNRTISNGIQRAAGGGRTGGAGGGGTPPGSPGGGGPPRGGGGGGPAPTAPQPLGAAPVVARSAPGRTASAPYPARPRPFGS